MFDALGEPGFDWGRMLADLQNARDWAEMDKILDKLIAQRDQARRAARQNYEAALSWKEYAEELERRRLYNVLEQVALATDGAAWRQLCYTFAERFGVPEAEVERLFLTLRKIIKQRVKKGEEPISEYPFMDAKEFIQFYTRECPRSPIPPDGYPRFPTHENPISSAYDPDRHSPYLPPKGRERLFELLEAEEAELDLTL